MMNEIGHGWGMGWWWIIGILIVVMIVWLIVRSNANKPHQSGGKSSLDILKERYAKGEIDKEEFDKKKKDLM